MSRWKSHTSSHAEILSYPNICTQRSRHYIIHTLVQESLISVGQFCDAGCETYFNVFTIKFTFQDKCTLSRHN